MDVGPVVFDLDGVLVDTELIWGEVRRELALAHGGRWHERANSDMQGLSTAEWTAYMARSLGVRLAPEAIAARVTEAMLRRYAAAPPFLPGARETVLRLARAGRPLGLASSSPRALIDALLDAGELAGALAAVVASEEVPRGKPAPDVYLEAARRLEVEPSTCTAVEDSTNGLLAAHAAGMRVLAVPNPHDPPSAQALALAERVAPSVAELF